MEVARVATLFVLDIDGVLVDPRPSFYAGAREVSSWAATRALGKAVEPAVTEAEIQAFKMAGGWNDDFDLAVACTWALIVRECTTPAVSVSETAGRVAGGVEVLARFVREALPSAVWEKALESCDTEMIRARAAVRYAGRGRSRDLYGLEPDAFPDLPIEGLWGDEPVLCQPASIRALGGPFGIFTGRNAAEAELALGRLDLFVAQELRAVDDGEFPRKPAPDALVRLAQSTKGPIVYVGDSIDDERAALGYSALAALRPLPDLVFVRIISENELPKTETMAPILAPSLDAFARVLRAAPPEATT
jgi:phosphoglycolate phosphatase-like HAD superfamily hydrolase